MLVLFFLAIGVSYLIFWHNTSAKAPALKNFAANFYGLVQNGQYSKAYDMYCPVSKTAYPFSQFQQGIERFKSDTNGTQLSFDSGDINQVRNDSKLAQFESNYRQFRATGQHSSVYYFVQATANNHFILFTLEELDDGSPCLAQLDVYTP